MKKELDMLLLGEINADNIGKIAEVCPIEFRDIIKSHWAKYALDLELSVSKCDKDYWCSDFTPEIKEAYKKCLNPIVQTWKWKSNISEEEKKKHKGSIMFISKTTTIAITLKMEIIAWFLSEILSEVPVMQ